MIEYEGSNNTRRMKQQGYRHGEIALIKVTEIPEGLVPSQTKVFMTGSHGNDHSIDNGTLYLLEKPEGFVFGYLEAKNTSLYHPEHKEKDGKASIDDGFYKLVKQQEHTPDGLIPVID